MRHLKRLFIILAALLLSKPPRKGPCKLAYHPAYFTQEHKAKKSMHYTGEEYYVVDTYKELTFYKLMHSPRFYSGWKYYEYVSALRGKYGIEISRLSVN